MSLGARIATEISRLNGDSRANIYNLLIMNSPCSDLLSTDCKYESRPGYERSPVDSLLGMLTITLQRSIERKKKEKKGKRSEKTNEIKNKDNMEV